MISCSGKRSIFDASDYAYRLRNLERNLKENQEKNKFSIFNFQLYKVTSK